MQKKVTSIPRNLIVFDLIRQEVAPKALTAEFSQIRIFVGKILETSLGTPVQEEMETPRS